MNDKEVGELWRRIKLDCPTLDGCPIHGEIIALIRKLVEERQAMHETNPCHCPGGVSLKHVLDDFGIDPATWEYDDLRLPRSHDRPERDR